jgi:hypothetical protein
MTIENDLIEMYKGDTKKLRFFIHDENGVAVDLTGSSIKWEMSRKASSVTLISKATGGGGIDFTNPAGGFFIVTLDPSDTSELKARTYYHEAEMIDGSGIVATVAVGSIKLIEDLILSQTP